MSLVYQGNSAVFKVASMGHYDNNGYVLADPQSRDCYIVDAPDQIERLILEASNFHVKGCIITHAHPDHIAGHARLIELLDIPVLMHAKDSPRMDIPPYSFLNDGELLKIGNNTIEILHTPGHTQGGICLLLEECLISGDTLFPGGPGYTRTPEDFAQVVRSVTDRLLKLPEDTIVLPGHGEGTTIGDSKRGYDIFSAKNHLERPFGHVNWLTT